MDFSPTRKSHCPLTVTQVLNLADYVEQVKEHFSHLTHKGTGIAHLEVTDFCEGLGRPPAFRVKLQEEVLDFYEHDPVYFQRAWNHGRPFSEGERDDIFRTMAEGEWIWIRYILPSGAGFVRGRDVNLGALVTRVEKFIYQYEK